MENQKLQSRRDFMRTAGKIVLGATALGVANPLLSAYDSAKAETTIEAPAHPFTYQKLDPTATLERGYKSFFELGGCAAGAFDAIIGQLADLVGYPFNQVPAALPALALRPCAVPSAAAPAPSACCASPRTQRPFWRICAPGTVSMSSPHTIPTTMRPPRPLPTP